MPVKNTARYLGECIDSILQQTLMDWELLAVDDHSSDDSLEILNLYASSDARIKIFRNAGSGIISALQTGYKKAAGNFITRMDSDDINEPEKYEHMMGQLKHYGMGHIAVGQVKYFATTGVKDGFKKYEDWLNELIENGLCFEEIYKECVIPSPCWMLHRTDFDFIGGFDSEMYPEDYDLCFRMYRKGLKPIPSKKVLFHWRDYPSRTSRTNAHYQEKELLRIKCHYFSVIDFDKNKNLMLWGAGKRGKFIASYLLENNISFQWICNNKNKIGHNIYGVVLQSNAILTKIDDKQIIVSVAKRQEREEIKKECAESGWEFYFFC